MARTETDILQNNFPFPYRTPTYLVGTVFHKEHSIVKPGLHLLDSMITYFIIVDSIQRLQIIILLYAFSVRKVGIAWNMFLAHMFRAICSARCSFITVDCS